MVEEVYAPIIDSQMTLHEALQREFKYSSKNQMACKGFNQSSKAIMGSRALFVMLAKNYDEIRSGIIRGLAKNANIPIIEFETCEDLGVIVGLVKNPKHEELTYLRCGVATIKGFVEFSDTRKFIENTLCDYKQEA